MRICLILFLSASFSIYADELDVFFEALNKNYLFNEIVYENELLGIAGISSLAFIGALLGDQAGFYIGKWAGPYFQETQFVKKRKSTTQKASNMIANYGNYVIFVGRFFPAIRSIIPAMLGVAGFNSLKFLILDLLACFLWCFALGAITIGIGTIL